jgi:hypothetical protein
MKTSVWILSVIVLLLITNNVSAVSSTGTGGLSFDWLFGDVANTTVGGVSLNTIFSTQSNINAVINASIPTNATINPNNINASNISGRIGNVSINMNNSAWFNEYSWDPAQTNFYINSTCPSTKYQCDIIRIDGLNNGSTGNYTTAINFNMIAHGGSGNGVQGVAGAVFTDGVATAKAIHGSAADIGSSGGTITGVIGEIFPHSNATTGMSIALQSTCTGTYWNETAHPGEGACIGVYLSNANNAAQYVAGIYNGGSGTGSRFTNYVLMDNPAFGNFLKERDGNGQSTRFVVDSNGYMGIHAGENPLDYPIQLGNSSSHYSLSGMAESWLTWPSDSKHKDVKSKVKTNETKNINKTLSWNSTIWARNISISDSMVLNTLPIRFQDISAIDAFDSIPETKVIDVSTYSISYIVDPKTGNTTEIKIPITNYTSSYQYTSDGSIIEIRTPLLSNVPTGKYIKKLKTNVKFNESNGKFYKSIPYTNLELETTRKDLKIKAELSPKYTNYHIGGMLDDPNAPDEIKVFSDNGTIEGYDLQAFILYQQETIREALIQLQNIQFQIDELKKTKP